MNAHVIREWLDERRVILHLVPEGVHRLGVSAVERFRECDERRAVERFRRLDRVERKVRNLLSRAVNLSLVISRRRHLPCGSFSIVICASASP